MSIPIIKQAVRDPETYKIIENAEGRCPCGRTVELGHFTSTCACGRDYNWNGTELAPRSQWGEDTGESYADVADIDHWEN